MQESMYVMVLLCVLSGVAGQELVMDPATSTHTVVEGKNARLNCYIRNSENILHATWKIEDTFVAKTVGNASNCRVVYGPNNVYSGETTTASCNHTFSSLMIENFTTVEAKNWSCSSGGQRVHILLMTQKDPSDLPTSPLTTDVPGGLKNTSTEYQQTDLDADHNLTMIYSLSAGGIFVLVLVLACVLKVRFSRRENPIYETSGTVIASEARHDVPVTDGHPDSVEVSALYAKVHKSRGGDAEARA